MKYKLTLAAITVLGGAAFSIATASAMPVAPLGQSNIANVETVALVCGRHGCVRTRPVYRPAYRRGVVVVRRPYAHRYYRRY
jgi:hypothetical protein